MVSVVVTSTTFDGLQTMVQSLELPQGTANSLITKINTAQDKFNSGNTHAAINVLNALINTVNAQDGHQIPTQQAEQIRDWAQSLIEHM